jgi:nucleoside-triphosphatase
VITLLMGWLYSGLQDGSFFGLEGLAAGLQMNFRAALMIIGFAAIGRELVNPIIKKYFSGSRFRQLAGSLEVAFDTLPLVIANLPAPKNILKRPVGTMKQLVGQADTWLEKISLQFSDKPFVIIVTGGFGSGKSRTVFALAEMLKLENIQIGGFVAPSVRENGERVGYDIYDIAHSNSHQLARTYGDDTMSFIGRFYFRTDGIETGKRILADASLSKPDWVIIDEIGPWEMAGQGWAQSINHLFGTSTANMIWVVRETLVEDVIHGWNIEDYQIIRASESAAHDMMKIIRQRQLNSDSSAKSGQATHD